MLTRFKEMWSRQDFGTKAMAVGVIVLMAASIVISAQKAALQESEQGDESAEESQSTTLASEDAQDAAALAERLTAGDGQWEATEDDLCVLIFEQSEDSLSFQEYNGDLREGASITFSAINQTEDGWQGRWRVIYEDSSDSGNGEYGNKATSIDAYFQFTEDRDTGICTIRSEAFPTYETYRQLPD